MTSLDYAGFLFVLLSVVALVFFQGGRLWERIGDLPPVIPPPPPRPDADRETAVMLDWVHEVAAPPALTPVPAAALVPLPPPPPRTPLPGPVRAYSALAAWRLERDTATTADTSVTKLAARIVDGMVFRDQIDRRAAAILTQLRTSLHGERAA